MLTTIYPLRKLIGNHLQKKNIFFIKIVKAWHIFKMAKKREDLTAINVKFKVLVVVPV